jgi:peptide deformylase
VAYTACHGQDHFGEPIRVGGTGTLARCLQHETDHLNGIMMQDHLTAVERRDLRRQHKKVAAHYASDWPT